MVKKFYIDKFYFQSATYKLIDRSKAEIYLGLDYEAETFTVEKVSGEVTQSSLERVENFARALLKKKSRVNNVSLLKEKYPKIFQS